MTEPRSALEREYSPSSCIASIDVELDRYAAASRAASALPHRRISSAGSDVDGDAGSDVGGDAGGDGHDVGDERPGRPVVDEAQVEGERQGLIVFEGPAGSPLHVFVHGGYWQALSAADSLGPAPEFVAAGWSYAAIDYTLAPTATIGDQIEQCVRAVRRVVAELRPAALVLSGSSAGAHLAAHVAHRAVTTDAGFTVDRLVLLSGIYDLSPLVHTYVNDALGLDPASAATWSVPLTPRPSPEVLVLHGEFETAAFKAQSARVAASWQVPVVEVIGRNHFDLLDDLAAIDLRIGMPGAGQASLHGPGNGTGAVVSSMLSGAERPGAPRRLERSVLHASEA